MARKRKSRKKQNDERQLQLFTFDEMSGASQPVQTAPVSQAIAETPSEPSETAHQAPHTPLTIQMVTETEPDTPSQMTDEEHLLTSMRRALMIISRLKNHEVRLIAMESATLAQEGISFEQIYKIPALEGMGMDGYDFSALYYVSFAQAFPSMIDRINLPYSDLYQKALEKSTYFNS